MPTISVIIPAYNVEKYLDKCMNSVLNQSFTDFEVLLIDDGAKDSTVQLCDKYAEKDTRVKTYHKKNGGLSDDAMYELRGKNVTIIGGEAAISKAEEEEIGLEAESVARIAGKNRQETNALIIEKYYDSKFASNVIVAKDGQHKKSELIDALAAANFASNVIAPIVLATNKLSDSQINALELNAQSAESLYQVGIGVDRDNVVKVIANLLGLAN